MTNPMLHTTRSPDATTHGKVFIYGALIFGTLIVAYLTTIPLGALTKNLTTTLILAALVITANTLCAFQAGHTWHTHRRQAILLGTTTALIGTAMTLMMLATPDLYTHADTGYTLIESLALTRSSAYISPLIYALFHIIVSTLTAFTAYHSTKNMNTSNG